MTASPAVRLELLGPPRALQRTNDGWEELEAPKLSRAWLLLAAVLRHPRSRAEVARLLWDGSGDRSRDLNGVTHSARQVLGPARDALIARGSIRLDRRRLRNGVTLTSDLDVFYALAARRDPELACQSVRMHRGQLIEGKVFDQAGEQWLEEERTRQERQLRVYLQLIFPEADEAELDEYVQACRAGKAESVADMAPAVSRARPVIRSAAARTVKKAPIGVIAPVSAWPTAFYTNIIKGIRKGAESDHPDRRRRILVFDVAREDIDEVDAVLASALEHDIPGLITLNATWSDHMRETMLRTSSRVVSVMVDDPAPPVCCSVVLDNTAFTDLLRHVLLPPCVAAVLVTPPLLDRFYRNVIDFARNDKRQAYEILTQVVGLRPGPVHPLDAGLKGQPIDAGFAHVVEIPSYEAGIGEQLFDAIADHLPANTAVVFLNDCQAASFLAACSASGRSAVDRRLCVSAYEDTDAARWLGISTVDPCLDAIGQLAYEQLQAALDDPAFSYRPPHAVPGTLRLRPSTTWKTGEIAAT